MSDHFQFIPFQTTQPVLPTTTTFNDTLDFAKQQQAFDFNDFSYGSDNFASFPANNQHLDQFDNEIDNSLAQYDVDIHQLPFDVADPFTLLRNDTPTRGLPSTFTVSSESVSGYEPFETLSAYSESHYYPQSENALSEIDMEMKRFGLSPSDDLRFGISPPSSATNSPPLGVPSYSPTYSSRGSFSEYEGSSPVRIHLPSSSASDYYPQMPVSKYPQTVAQATVSPANVSVQLPNTQPIQPTTVVPSQRSAAKSESGITSVLSKDPKRKYQCPTCPRAFARAYNLKTHIQTHDPNRLKPYACHHKSCGRSFSRKHDLTRHLISIHRSDGEEIDTNPQPVGVAAGNRKWCDKCGTSWVANGKLKGCKCDDVK